MIVTFPGQTHLLSHKKSIFKVAIDGFRLNAVPIHDSKLYISIFKQIVDFLVSLLLQFHCYFASEVASEVRLAPLNRFKPYSKIFY